MLVNLTANEDEIKRIKQVFIDRKDDFDAEYIENYKPQSDPQWIQETGIYQCRFSFNFQLDEFMEFVNINKTYEYEFEPFGMPKTLEESRNWNWENHKSAYGVADSIEQIKEYYKDAIADPDNKYFIYLTPVWQDKENKGKGGGWRWHKWGTYIGVLDSKCEYLDDEEFGDDFEYVICFHIVRVP